MGIAACGGGNASEPPPTQPTVATPPPAPPSPAPAPVASTPPAPPADSSASAGAPGPLASVLTTDPAAVQKLFDDASHAPAASLKAKGVDGGDPLAKGLRDVAKKAAPGMEPEGPLATGTLKEKQSVQTDVTLQSGKCYTIVGYSKKVKDLDLYLLLSGILSGQDTTDDSTPVIGASPQPMCPAATTAITYKLAIVADQGAGEVAVQLYSKSK